MTQIQTLAAFDAFESQLKTLCLTEFPCGLGSWRSIDRKKKDRLSKTAQTDERYSITIKDYGAQYEKAETLEELVVVKSSPWNLDYSWSNEAKSLREIAVRSPWLIDERFVLSHFHTLRIIDKKVTDIDENFLHFNNLEELTLTANYLRTVNSKYLPPKLKVLELCANQISNLADLCIEPRSLMHLGLGYNKLHMIDDYITAVYWPTLLSLDLSFNSLTDLLDVVRKLQTLPKLRNLLLHGNPLSLVPAYRGYTIDSLRKLEFLDGIPISADDKHKYKGLAKRKEFILDEAKVTLRVEYIRGVPMPEEMQNAEEQPEFPIISRRYFVQFLFLEDSSSNQHELLDLVKEQQLNAAESHEQLNSVNERQSGLSTAAPGGSSKNVNFANEVDTVPDIEQGDSLPGDMIDQQSPSPSPRVQSAALPSPGEVGMELVPPDVPLAPINSAMLQWDEEILLEWWQVYSRDNLLGMRDFLKKGMEMRVMEEKILSYPAPEPDATPSSSPEGASKKKDDKKKEKVDKGKDDKNKKKKKGEPDVELQHMPAEYTELCTFHIPLADFLENEYEFETVFIEGGGQRTPSPPPMSDGASKKDPKKDKKKGSAGKKGKDDASKGKKSPDKKGGKDAVKKGSMPHDLTDDEPPPPPPPLEVHVAVRIHQWKTATDSLKDDDNTSSLAAQEQNQPSKK